MSGLARNRVALGLIVLGGIVGFFTAVAVYAHHVLVDRDGFADRVTEAVKRPAVSKEISRRLGDAVVAAAPDAVAGERPLEDALGGLISSGALDGVVREAALVMHDAAFTQRAENLELDLEDGALLVASAVGAHDPEAQQALASELDATVVRVEHRGAAARATSLGELITNAARFLTIGAWALFLGAIAVAVDRRQAVFRVGLAVTGAGAGVLVLEIVGKRLAERANFASPDAVDQALDVFLGGLVPLGLAIAGAGALIAAVGSGRFTSEDAESAVGRLWRFLREPPVSARGRIGRVLVFLALGLALVIEPLATLHVALVLLGLFLLVEALSAAIPLLGGRTAAGASSAATPMRRRMAIGLGVVAVLGALALTAYAVARTPGSDEKSTGPCNGSPELCDRPIDAIAFPTAHNAMSSANAGFVDPNQAWTPIEQLDAGIRGLLIDSLMARPTDRRATAITVLDGEVRASAEKTIGSAGIAAVDDLLAREVARPTGDPEPFLCHVLCELGALRMVDTLTDIRRWLERNPREVLVIVIQDLVTPEDTERVFRESGLYDHVYTWNADDPAAPTPRQMIDAGRQVLVMAEANGFPNGWYQPGYDRLLKETPYDETTAESLASDESCRPNRGNESNPLFLLNNFLEVYPPRPSRAAVVNDHDFLLRRARRCQQIRGAFPNLIAVDFAQIGDVVEVADELNGV